MADDVKRLKRKLVPTTSSLARKKPKKNHVVVPKVKKSHVKSLSSTQVAVDDLPWKSVCTQDIGEFGDNGEGGMMGLEEVEGVEVVYGEGKEGRIVGFRVIEPSNKMDNTTTKTSGNDDDEKGQSVPASVVIDAFDNVLLPSWSKYPFHPALLHSIHKRGFTNPTPIQERTFDVFLHSKPPSVESETDKKDNSGEAEEIANGTLRHRDIIGIAQTGSGKTLAYGIPILHEILNSLTTPWDPSLPQKSVTVTSPREAQRRPLQALVLAPTRELALQVSEHLNACLDRLFAAQTQSELEGSKSRPPPPLSVAAIVGGMSAQKQRRILSRGVDVLVVTPGRFWDLCGEDPSLTAQLRSLRFLVLDEADRMVEAGHFQELDNILKLTARSTVDNVDPDDPLPPADLTFEDTVTASQTNESLQTFVFSATMSKDLQRDLKRNRGRSKRKGGTSSTLDDLIMRLDFRDPDPVVIDLSPVGGRVQGLQESKVECLSTDKDVYLYYFLLRHPGRSLVFLSSIDGIRRLMPMLELLKISAWPLHSGLQQKQRLKNFDRFKSTPNSVLLATDVAARGLDVPAVDHVIHYQVPRSADAYVHRNGRTARAMQQGFGLVLCAPDERRVFKGVLTGLGREEDDVPELNIDHDILGKLKSRVQLARQIDNVAHRVKKDNHDKNWMRETAEAMEIELGSDFDSDGSESKPKASIKRHRESKMAKLKAELKQALSQPLVARGVSAKYITSGTRRVVDDLVEGANHETMLGLQKMKAGSEVVRQKKKSGHTKRTR
ncbi:ATP-dependent RNA helicase [Hysterangium stoloniferum]|nr:ATP-dependent RNA helicase [Hysterangium stoloniferum]